MRIGYDGTPLIGQPTGIGNYTYDLIDAVATLEPGFQLRVMPVSWRMSRAANVPAAPNVELVRRLAPARPLRKMWQYAPVPPLEALLRCDVFHATNYVAPRSLRTPIVVSVHDLWFKDNPERVGAAEAELATLLPGILRRASAILTLSNYVRESLIEWLPFTADRTYPVPLAPHPRSGNAHRPAGVGERPFVLSLGSINQRKNLPLSLDALVHARRLGVEHQLVVAGGGASRESLASELVQRGLTSDDVVFLGYTDDGAVEWLLHNAEAFISSSLHEGFGIPMIEAMSAGLPVVAVDGGAVAEVTAGAALLTTPDAEEMGQALQVVTHDETRRGELTELGRKVGGTYSWERTARETLAVYRKVVSH